MLRFCHWFVGLDCWTITGHADETIRQRKAAINWFFLESHFELISYYKIVATAGQEATTNAVTGGTCAGHKPWATKKATENLCDDAIKLAVEEMIRWSTPIAQFSRTAQVDCEIRGKQIKKGDCLGLMYASANFDEEKFDNPFSFDVSRKPNHHLAFGTGPHQCLGLLLARLEMRIFFQQLIPRIESIELDGDPERLRASFVHGLKHLNIRYKLKPRS